MARHRKLRIGLPIRGALLGAVAVLALPAADARAANPDQANSGGGPQGDACDGDDDGDGISDADDRCHIIASSHTSGCPLARISLMLTYSPARERFSGKVKSQHPACLGRMKVRIYKVTQDNRVVGRPRAAANGRFSLAKRAEPGRYFAEYRRRVITDVVACRNRKSRVIDVG